MSFAVGLHGTEFVPQICRLLENEYLYELEERQKHDAISQAIQDVMEFRHSTVQSRGWSSDHIRKRQNAFVSEAKFIAEYWPHLRQGLPKGLGRTIPHHVTGLETDPCL